jgi:hypothetical protein
LAWAVLESWSSWHLCLWSNWDYIWPAFYTFYLLRLILFFKLSFTQNNTLSGRTTLKYHSKEFYIFQIIFLFLSSLIFSKTLWTDLIDIWQINWPRHREIQWLWKGRTACLWQRLNAQIQTVFFSILSFVHALFRWVILQKAFLPSPFVQISCHS